MYINFDSILVGMLCQFLPDLSTPYVSICAHNF